MAASLGLLLAGCSDDKKEAAGEAAPADACALVTAQEVESAFGEPVGPPTRSTQGVGGLPGTGCIYLTTETPGDAVLISRSVSDRSREAFDAGRAHGDPREVVAVDVDKGEAYVGGESGYLHEGSTVASVVVSRGDRQAATETARRLLQAAAKRL